MSALHAVVRPDGLEAIVGVDDAAWLAAEARKAKERVERYDGADGAAALFDEEDASDGDGGVCEGGDGWPEWLDLFFVADAVQWPPAPYLKYHSSIGAIGHGDVVWAAGEELARRILAHEAPFEAVGMGTRVLELGAGCGLPSLAAAHGGADVVATDAPVAGGIVALAATARRMGPTFDGRLRVRRLDWGDELCGNKNRRRVRPESPRRPPRHRRDACSMAWRCRFLAAGPSQDSHAIAAR